MTIIPEVRNDLHRAIVRNARARRRRLGITLVLTGTLAASGTAVAATGWNPLADKLIAQPTVNVRQPGTQYTPSTVRAAGENGRTPSEQTLAVIASMERWPSFRGTFKAKLAATIAKDLASGSTGSTERQLHRNCR